MKRRRIHFELSGEDLLEMLKDWARETFAIADGGVVEIELVDPHAGVEGEIVVEYD